MRAAVVYESWFGNTRAVATAIVEELRADGEALLLSVYDPVPALDEIDLLVVGAPTHAHGLSSGMTRKSALEQRGESGPGPGIGIRGWLQQLPEGEGRLAAAFDTRFEKSAFLVGSAARGVGKRLERRGFELAAPPESFFVRDTEGPLADGEVERARAWARSLAAGRVGVSA